MMRLLRDFLLFFQRDVRIASSYRGPFVLEMVEALFGAATFYYVARFVDSPQLREVLPHGTSGSQRHGHAGAAAGDAGVAASGTDRIEPLSFRAHDVASGSLSGLGKRVVRFSASRERTGCRYWWFC